MLFLLLACSGGDDSQATDSPLELGDNFCEGYDEAGSVKLGETSDGGTSGYVVGQLIQDVVVEPHDPQYVGFVDYVIENLDVGGVQILGRTDQDGLLTETLGPGNWHLKTSGHQGPYECAADMDFLIQAGKVTRLCIDMNCR